MIHSHRFLLLVLWLTVSVSGAALDARDAEAETLLLTGARLVDPGNRSIEPASLLLSEGRVVARGAANADGLLSDHPEATRIDLTGKYLLPALVDLRTHPGRQRSPGHVDHLDEEGTARLLLAAGVSRYVVHGLRQANEASVTDPSEISSPGARIHGGGPMLTVRGGFGADFPSARVLASEAALDSVLAEVGSGPATVVFVGRPPHRRLPVEWLARILESSERVVVAVGSWRDVREALEAGATTLCHLPDGAMDDEVLALVRQRAPQWIPTLAVGLDLAPLLADEILRSQPLLQRVAPVELIEDYPKLRIPQARFADLRARERTTYDALRSLNEAGVQWLAGSDAGSVGTFFGWSLHRELHHWWQAGIEPWEVLRAATVASAAFLGETVGFEPGATADYLILDQNPVDDLGALAGVDRAVFAGSVVDLPSLAASVERRLEAVDPPNPLPFGHRGGLIAVVVALFAVLLTLRILVKRAARAS